MSKDRDFTALFGKSKRVRWIEKQKRVVLLDPLKGKYYKLNKTASLIWNLCDGTRSEIEIAFFLQRTFDIENIEKIVGDVKGLLTDLYRQGLISIKNERQGCHP